MQKKFANKMITHFYDDGVHNKITKHLLNLLQQQPGYDLRPLVVLCIGSDRYTGDSLGPLIGTYLQEKGIGNVHGSLEQPVHAGNLVQTITSIYYEYENPLILALDACLGKEHEIGNIEIWEGSLQAGIAVGNYLLSTPVCF
jgi:putative sporulation protein YyaC